MGKPKEYYTKPNIIKNKKVAAQVEEMHSKWKPAETKKQEPDPASNTSLKKKYGITRSGVRAIKSEMENDNGNTSA